MIGHMSGAYTAKVSRDLAISSRFDFNVYSFESEWTMGAEWWLRRPARVPTEDDIQNISTVPLNGAIPPLPEVNGVVKARASTNNVRKAIKHLALLNLSCLGRISHVGRSTPKHARQFRRRLRPVQ